MVEALAAALLGLSPEDRALIHASKPHSTYQNTLNAYKATCELVTRARLEGIIPFEAIDDPTRPVSLWNCHGSVAPFVPDELDGLRRRRAWTRGGGGSRRTRRAGHGERRVRGRPGVHGYRELILRAVGATS